MSDLPERRFVPVDLSPDEGDGHGAEFGFDYDAQPMSLEEARADVARLNRYLRHPDYPPANWRVAEIRLYEEES